MARGKTTEKKLSSEEKLQQTLLPAEEQPYKIPDNWCWVRLGELYEINPKLIADDTVLASFVPMERIEAGMTGQFTFEIQPWAKARKGHTQFADGDVAFAKISPCFENRKSMIVQGLTNGIGGGTTELIILRQTLMNQKYTFLLISTEDFISRGSATYSGTVGQQRISMDFVKMYPVPVPPLPEQQRIVDRIESLFAKLDEAKEKAQAVVDGFELRKSAILHKAFSGELTEHWRKEHSTDEWFTSTFGQYTNSQYGYTESATQEPIGPKFLRITDIQDGTVDWDKVPYCNISKDDFEKYLIKSGDIMIARTGATTGKSYLIVDNVKAVFASYLIRLTMKQTGLMATYLYYFMQSPSYWQQITEFSAGIAQPGVNAKKLQKIELPIPSVEEQREIVFILDKFLKKERQAKDAAEAVLDQIDTMKKAILARAFRGELGTNDPTEESAAEMVKLIVGE